MYEGHQSINKSAHKSKSSLHNSGLQIANISVSNISNNSMSRPYEANASGAKHSPIKSQLNIPANNDLKEDGLETENNKTVPDIKHKEQ